MNKIMQPEDLKKHVRDFLASRSNGSLGTCLNQMPRSSPVRYFLGRNLTIYILSAGGEKFRAIKQNPNVCLLVNTEYTGYTRIKGVQVFGKAVTSEDQQELVDEALEFCPDYNVTESLKNPIKAIKILPEEVVYLDSQEDGDRTKQYLTKEHIMDQTQQVREPILH